MVVTLIFPQTLGTEGRLPNIEEHFAHVLLFACPECERPLASACASNKRNLEEADAHFFNPHCHCGWSASKRHGYSIREQNSKYAREEVYTLKRG